LRFSVVNTVGILRFVAVYSLHLFTCPSKIFSRTEQSRTEQNRSESATSSTNTIPQHTTNHNTMAPRQKDVLGELVWVLQGKTEHHAHRILNRPPTIDGGIPYLWIKWATTGKPQLVEETSVRREDAPVGRRSRRATRTNDTSQHAMKKEEDSKASPAHKLSKGQQEGRPKKKARTAKTAENPASLDAEDSLASASHPTMEEIQAQGYKKNKKTAASRRYGRLPRIVASPPKAAPSSVPNIEEQDWICTKDHGWAVVIGYSFSSPRKGNHPKLFQIEWMDEDETILKGYVSEDNITNHIPHASLADAFDEASNANSEDAFDEASNTYTYEIEDIYETNQPLVEKVLRTADELYLTVDQKTTTLKGISMSVLEACNIVEDGKDHFHLYYDIIKQRILCLLLPRTNPNDA
jgi:hypothetical protein